LVRTATRFTLGTASLSSSSRFTFNTWPRAVTPVTLPPGRARLAMSPPWTGLPVVTITMGIVEVAFLAAEAPGLDPVTITSTFARTSSSASWGRRSRLPSAKRSSNATFWPSIQPSSLRPCRNSASMGASVATERGDKRPIRATLFGCCARAASGHATAAPPRSVMKSRRFIQSPRRRARQAAAAGQGRARGQS
jgi:hypothetical protein